MGTSTERRRGEAPIRTEPFSRSLPRGNTRCSTTFAPRSTALMVRVRKDRSYGAMTATSMEPPAAGAMRTMAALLTRSRPRANNCAVYLLLARRMFGWNWSFPAHSGHEWKFLWGNSRRRRPDLRLRHGLFLVDGAGTICRSSAGLRFGRKTSGHSGEWFERHNQRDVQRHTSNVQSGLGYLHPGLDSAWGDHRANRSDDTERDAFEQCGVPDSSVVRRVREPKGPSVHAPSDLTMCVAIATATTRFDRRHNERWNAQSGQTELAEEYLSTTSLMRRRDLFVGANLHHSPKLRWGQRNRAFLHGGPGFRRELVRDNTRRWRQPILTLRHGLQDHTGRHTNHALHLLLSAWLPRWQVPWWSASTGHRREFLWDDFSGRVPRLWHDL